jgi:hypothetical protein
MNRRYSLHLRGRPGSIVGRLSNRLDTLGPRMRAYRTSALVRVKGTRLLSAVSGIWPDGRMLLRAGRRIGADGCMLLRASGSIGAHRCRFVRDRRTLRDLWKRTESFAHAHVCASGAGIFCIEETLFCTRLCENRAVAQSAAMPVDRRRRGIRPIARQRTRAARRIP